MYSNYKIVTFAKMDNILKYKDFIATVKYSEEDGAFIGRIEGISSIVSFEGESVSELKKAFKEAVESYLSVCERKEVKEAIEKQVEYV